jgi:hypothetical protein
MLLSALWSVRKIFFTEKLNVSFCVVLISVFLYQPPDTRGQSLSFEVVSNPDVDFVFNTIQKYQTGIVAMNAITLRVTATGVSWDLYVGAQTDLAGTWDVISSYGLSGELPIVALLKIRFRNTANTALIPDYFDLTDISSPTYVIGSAIDDPGVSCPDQGTNEPGSFLAQPQCYQFNVDLRITPGFDLRPGLYRLHIKYVLVENL